MVTFMQHFTFIPTKEEVKYFWHTKLLLLIPLLINLKFSIIPGFEHQTCIIIAILPVLLILQVIQGTDELVYVQLNNVILCKLKFPFGINFSYLITYDICIHPSLT